MEFKQEALLERELEIASYLLRRFSLEKIGRHLGINKKIVKAHIRNMMQKLHAENLEELIESTSSNRQNGIE